MSLLEKVETISFGRDLKHNKKLFKIKSGILHANIDNVYYPILYFSRPRNVSEEDFQEILNNLEIKLTKP